MAEEKIKIEKNVTRVPIHNSTAGKALKETSSALPARQHKEVNRLGQLPRASDKARKLLKGKKKHPVFRGRFGKKCIRRKSKDKWNKWRRPRGIDITFDKADGAVVDIGYGNKKEIRHLHPCGMREVLVCCVKDLEGMAAAKGFAARISGTVGKKKRADIVKKAKELEIKVLNG